MGLKRVIVKIILLHIIYIYIYMLYVRSCRREPETLQYLILFIVIHLLFFGDERTLHDYKICYT